MKKVLKVLATSSLLSVSLMAQAAPHIECKTQFNNGTEEVLTQDLDAQGNAIMDLAGLSSGQSLKAVVEDSKIKNITIKHPDTVFYARALGLGARKRAAKVSLAFFNGIHGAAQAEIKAQCNLKEVAGGGGRGGGGRGGS